MGGPKGNVNTVFRLLRVRTRPDTWTLQQHEAVGVDARPAGRSTGWRRDVDGNVRRLTFAAVVYEGILQITDLPLFHAAITVGIGPAKAYGFGLLSLARVAENQRLVDSPSTSVERTWRTQLTQPGRLSSGGVAMPEPDGWRERRRQWEKFAAWEKRAQEAQSKWDLRARLEWFQNAWNVAARFHPGWSTPTVRPEKVGHLQRVRARLAVLGMNHEKR